jgi:hypothetical protein
VPSSFVGQWIQICIGHVSASTCKSIRIDDGATVSIPVTSNVSATVKSSLGNNASKTNVKPKSAKQIAKSSSAFSSAVAPAHAKKQTTKGRKH